MGGLGLWVMAGAQEVTVQGKTLKEMFSEFFNTCYKHQVFQLFKNFPAKKSIALDYQDIEKFDTGLADRVLSEPEHVLVEAQQALKEMHTPTPNISQYRILFEPHIRFYNLPMFSEHGGLLIQDLSEVFTNKWVRVKGIISKRADVTHKLKVAHLACLACDEEFNIPVGRDGGYPGTCDACGKKAMKLDEEKSIFLDVQRAEVQELLERVPGGAQAAKAELVLEDDLVNSIVPGDSMDVCGIFRLRKLEKGPRNMYSRYIEVVHAKNLHIDFEELSITEDEARAIRELATNPKIYEKIVNSIAPMIYGHTEVKEAIVLQLFGGTKEKKFMDAKLRDDIHILLIGDPGAAKTRFLQHVSDLAPKSIYVSGKSVTGVGLTASAERDELSEGGWTLKAGALVLASGGIVCIDEFDKIEDTDRAAMHEAMESQSYHHSTKLMLSDGREMPMGELVESYMEKHKDRIIQGKNCLILREGIENIRVLTTDFENITETCPTQISKHTAPEHYIKVRLQTGRELIVTPEHPFWVIEHGEIITKEAQKLTQDDYTLMPRKLPIKISDTGTPRQFFKFLGYHITDGGYELNRGIKNGINFYNKYQDLVEDYADAVSTIFNVPIYSRTNPTSGVIAQRITSMPVLKRLIEIYPPLAGNGKEKHIPPQFISAPDEYVSQMLRAIFEGDGTFSHHHIGLVGENKTFILQVQLLLLRFGIRSVVFKDKTVFRLNITGKENLGMYRDAIGFLSKKKGGRLTEYLLRDGAYRNTTDVIPNCATPVFNLLKVLKIPENETFGYGLHEQKKGYCFTRKNFIALCKRMREKVATMNDMLKHIESCSFDELLSMRVGLNISQRDLASCASVTRSAISYWEKKRISTGRYSAMLRAVLLSMLSHEKELAKLEKLAYGDVGVVRIKRIEKVPNNGDKWVYDVTIEPNRAFISECTVLHNTISVAKAGMVAKFRAKTAILAAANPKRGRFDNNMLLAEQFDIPPTLLSRFDLIFPIRDTMDEKKDSELADHILNSHISSLRSMPVFERTFDIIEKNLLKKYVAYARQTVRPVLGDEAKDRIKDFYVQLRKLGKQDGAVPITPRQIEGLIRLSEASAKIRLSEKVELGDAERAIRLTEFVLRQIMYDKEIGRYDVDIVNIGAPKSHMDNTNTIVNIIRQMQSEFDKVEVAKVIEEAEKTYKIERHKVERIIQELRTRNEIYSAPEDGYSYIKLVSGEL